MANERTGDLVLPQGTYVLLQDGASGEVKVVVGPSKVSMADTDKPVVYERDSRRYAPNIADKAIRTCPAADEGQYIVLTNPTAASESKDHPGKGKQDNIIQLDHGRRINIQGPKTFALYPGQVADVIDGHQLKSNEFLIIRVYNEEEARANLADAVVKTADTGSDDTGEDKKKTAKKTPPAATSLFDEKDIRTGNLLIIKGTDVSFYIPPTGIEVLEDKNGNYTRDAVTLERLEYCILLDQNGDKRYVKGPAVVFPKPTESFIENSKKKVFKAIELNENMALYIKVIADYSEEDGKSFKAGDELFISGKEQKIYFPRPEHAIIKYGSEMIHFATAVPAGEGRYLLDKVTGEVKTVKGPEMLLPDPRKNVIVKRVLDPKTVKLWFPGNQEALEHNQNLSALAEGSMDNFVAEYSNQSRGLRSKSTFSASSVAGSITEEMTRNSTYTKPRTIQLDTKYEGSVLLNIWPNYAVQIVNREGERRVVEGPSIVMLNYDEVLDVLEFSTETPKTDEYLMKTVYLQTKNNVVSDLITVETKDLVNINIKVSYKVDFDGDPKKWFNVSDYVKLLTQHMRSIVRNAVKKQSVEEFYEKAADIIRDVILGEVVKDKGRAGRKFAENDMNIYDVEVLGLEIGDRKIASMIVSNQHEIVEQNLKGLQMKKSAEFQKKEEQYKRDIKAEELKTVEADAAAEELKLQKTQDLEEKRLDGDVKKQDKLDQVTTRRNKREKAKAQVEIDIAKAKSDISVNEIKSQMDAITPGLIEAIVTSNSIDFTKILAENLTAQRNGSGLADLFQGGVASGLEGIMDSVKGTPMEAILTKLLEDTAKQQTKKSSK